MRIRPLPGKLHIVQKLIEEIPEFGECDKVTGDDCFVARLFVRSMGELDKHSRPHRRQGGNQHRHHQGAADPAPPAAAELKSSSL